MKQYINDNWYFTPNYTDELLNSNLNNLQVVAVRLPHTVKELPYNYCNEKDYQMVSGYAYELYAPNNWEGKYVGITFLAAGHEAEVYLNGECIGKHSSGYTAFTLELKNLKYEEKNRIVVKLDSRESLNIPPFGNVIDYLTYGGLYRGVYIEVKELSRLTDVYLYGNMEGKLNIEVSGVNTDGCGVQIDVLDNDNVVASIKDTYKRNYELQVNNVKLWDIDNPNLYNVSVKLLNGSELVDEIEDRVGFREIKFVADGFYLNNKKIKIRGLNRHQSWPYMGYAAPERAQKLDADILKYELGCNAVRTSHYPQSKGFIERCDEIGLLVFTEIPGWQHIGNEEWKKQAIKNTEEMILQYRNHPSIFIWGVRINESLDDDEFYTKTNELAHSLDATRPTGGVRYIKKSHLLEDVYTYNDFFHNGTNAGCESKKNVTPDMNKGYLITENNGHMFPTKPFDWEKKRLEHALRHARVINDVAHHSDIAGHFNWCMFDYNTHKDFGSGDRICYHGVMDMFRNPKLAASVFAAEGLETPVLAVSSSMDIGEHPAGSIGDIYAFTNADEVALYKNDEFVGKYTASSDYKDMKHGPVCVDDTIGCLLEVNEGLDKKTADDVKKVLLSVAKHGLGAMPLNTMLTAAKLMTLKHFSFAQATELYGKYVSNWGGKLTTWKFVAIKDGKEVATVIKGAVDSIHLDVRIDTNELIENESWDMATIRIRMLDNYGNVIPYGSHVVSIETEGVVEVVGPKHISLIGGQCGTYVRTTGKEGSATVRIKVEGVDEITIPLTVKKDNN
ncbi:MAG: glycoside hydrolase family 2 protein [Erysipelotrichales bacterium]|nr:glycoside hydrolase family 2 protein [Erysipelotrichales bacterium]